MSKPLAIARHTLILRALDAAGSVSVSDLADRFGVSTETIRRDLKVLADREQATLVHGGATAPIPVEPALAARATDNALGKAAIGHHAASMIPPGAVVLVDSGSTTYFLAKALLGRDHLTVITNSLPIARLLGGVEGLKTIMLGGEVHAHDEATFGIDTLAMLKHFQVDLAFVGAGGLSDDGDMTDYTRLAAEQRHQMMAASRTAYILADHTKFGRRTPVRIQPVDQIAGLITDSPLPSGPSAEAIRQKWPLIIVEP